MQTVIDETAEQGLKDSEVTQRRNLAEKVRKLEEQHADAARRYESEFDANFARVAKQVESQLKAARDKLAKFDSDRQRDREARESDEATKLRDELRKHATEFEKSLAAAADSARKLQETALAHQRAGRLGAGEPINLTSLRPKIQERCIDVLGSRGDVLLDLYGTRPSRSLAEILS